MFVSHEVHPGGYKEVNMTILIAHKFIIIKVKKEGRKKALGLKSSAVCLRKKKDFLPESNQS